MRFLSLRLQLFLLVVIVLVPWLALIAYTQADERREAIANVNADAMRLVRIVTSNQAAQVESSRQLLSALVSLPQLRAGDPVACGAYLRQMLDAYPVYLNLGVADASGDLWCSGLPMREKVNVSDRGYFRQAREMHQFAIGDYQIGRITHRPAINYAYPILDETGNTHAVVYAAESLSWLTAALANLKFPRGAMLVVVDGNGTVLARLPDAADSVGKRLPEPEVLAMLATQKDGGVFEAADAQGVARLWAHAPLIAGQSLHAAMGVSKVDAFARINHRLLRNIAALGLVTLVALAAAWFGGKFILRRVDALVTVTERLASGDLHARAPLVGGRSELEVLARAFNDMASTLQTRERELRSAEEKTRAAEIELAVTRSNMEIAKRIQRSLLPDDPLIFAGMQVAGRCIPAAAVGGDYFGYFPRGLDGVDGLIGDVSGHGIGAALLMAEARTTFMAERMDEMSAARILGKLNDLLFEDLDRSGQFITACCVTFDAAARELSYANAGHPPALLLRTGAAHCVALEADGMLLGAIRAVEFSEVRTRMGVGDVLVLYTDGITETRNAAGDLFGSRRLGEVIAEHRAGTPEQLISAVLSTLRRYAGDAPQDDDLTIVVMKLASSAIS